MTEALEVEAVRAAIGTVQALSLSDETELALSARCYKLLFGIELT